MWTRVDGGCSSAPCRCSSPVPSQRATLPCASSVTSASSAPGCSPPPCSGPVRDGRRGRGPGGCWRSRPCSRCAGAVAAAILGARDAVELAVLRWIPTVPGYLLAIVAILTLVDRARLRAGPRVAAEVALFLGACLVVVQLLVVGPAGRWTALAVDEKLVLAAAVRRHVGHDGRRADAPGRHRARAAGRWRSCCSPAPRSSRRAGASAPRPCCRAPAPCWTSPGSSSPPAC